MFALSQRYINTGLSRSHAKNYKNSKKQKITFRSLNFSQSSVSESLWYNCITVLMSGTQPTFRQEYEKYI